LTDEAWSYYSAVLDRAQGGRGKMIDVSGVFVRLRQIASGFVSIDGVPSPLASNPKLELFCNLLDELPPNEKVVVFNEFIYSGDLLEAELASREIGTARLYSKTRSKSQQLLRFLEDDDCRVFLVNSQSGAQGLNLQQAPYVVFYESPVSPIVRQQAEKRCHRPGQDKRVFVYDLVARRTVEEKILRFLAEGKDLFAALVEGGLGILRG
jgi:non-specific serine/threonine protein kinase